MKKVYVVLMALILCISSTACICVPNTPDVSDVSGGDSNLVNRVVCENDTYSIRLLHESDFEVQAIYGIGNGWVNVYGVYNGQEGFFYVNEAGRVLNNGVYQLAYPFNSGWAYAQKGDMNWFVLYPDGKEEPAKGDVSSSFYTREMIEVNGEERFYIARKSGGACDPIFSWIETADLDYNYAVLAEGEHKIVLINSDGEILVTLPDDCKGAVVGDSAMVGKFEGDGNYVLYRPMDYTGKVLGKHRFRVLTQISLFLAAGCLDNHLVLVDDKGEIVLDTDIAFGDVPEQGCLSFDKDLVAMLNKDGKLTIYKVELKQESLRRVALELLAKAAEIAGLYRSEGSVDMDEVLKEGTIVHRNGTSFTLDGDYYLCTASLFGKKLQSMQDLEKAITSVYTDSAADYYSNHSKFVEHDGALYMFGGGAGYLPISMPGSLQFTRVTEDEVTFNFSECYNSFADVSTSSYTMVKTSDGWRLNTLFQGIILG